MWNSIIINEVIGHLKDDDADEAKAKQFDGESTVKFFDKIIFVQLLKNLP